MILEDTVVFEKLFNLKVVSSEGEFSTLREILLQILAFRNVILYLAIMGYEYLKMTK